jgi:hypothetical protein
MSILIAWFILGITVGRIVALVLVDSQSKNGR